MRLSTISVLITLVVLAPAASYADKECVAGNNGLTIDKKTGEVANANRALQAIKSCVAENPNPKVKGIADKALPRCQAWLVWVNTKKENEDTKLRGQCKDYVTDLKTALAEPAASGTKSTPSTTAAAASKEVSNPFAGYEEKLNAAKSPEQKKLAAEITKEYKAKYNTNCAATSAAMACSLVKGQLAKKMAEFNAAAAGNSAPAKGGARVLSLPTKHK